MRTKRTEFATSVVTTHSRSYGQIIERAPDAAYVIQRGEILEDMPLVFLNDAPPSRTPDHDARRASVGRMLNGECTAPAESECTYEDDAPKDGVWVQPIVTALPGGGSWNPPPPGWKPPVTCCDLARPKDTTDLFTCPTCGQMWTVKSETP